MGRTVERIGTNHDFKLNTKHGCPLLGSWAYASSRKRALRLQSSKTKGNIVGLRKTH